jgi:heat shock protein HtpX
MILGNILKEEVPLHTMCGSESKGVQCIDTWQLTLLAFSLISAVIFTYTVGYFIFSKLTNYQGAWYTPGESEFMAEALGTLCLSICILPQSLALALWYVAPSFIKDWYELQPLPPRHHYIYSMAENVASELGVSCPQILYTQANIANCFNLGKRESESTIVFSRWLLSHLNPRELEAILAHEMVHAKNRDVTLMAYFSAVRWVILLSPLFVLGGFLYIFSQFENVPVEFVFYPEFWLLIIPFLLLYLFLALGILWFSRLREGAADAGAALLVGKNILEKTLYKLTCARSTRMALVSPCLMIARNTQLGGILSAHSPLKKRLGLLEKERYVSSRNSSPSIRSCLTYSVSIFLFIQLINYILSALIFQFTGRSPGGLLLVLVDPVTTAILLTIWHHHLSIRYLGFIVLIMSFLQVVLFFVLVLPACIVMQHLPSWVSAVSPEVAYVARQCFELTKNLQRTTVEVMVESGTFFLIAFPATLAMRGMRKHLKL